MIASDVIHIKTQRITLAFYSPSTASCPPACQWRRPQSPGRPATKCEGPDWVSSQCQPGDGQPRDWDPASAYQQEDPCSQVPSSSWTSSLWCRATYGCWQRAGVFTCRPGPGSGWGLEDEQRHLIMSSIISLLTYWMVGFNCIYPQQPFSPSVR